MAHQKQASESVPIPTELREIPQWCRWQLKKNPGGRPTKVPDRSTVSAKPSTWEDVADTRIHKKGGVGVILTDGVKDENGATLLALDVDACRSPATGRVSKWARKLCRLFPSYTEITPSGAGLRIWLKVKTAPGVVPVVKIPHPAPDGVDKTPEVQTFGCGPAGYVTVSGRQLKGSPDTLTTFDDFHAFEKLYMVEAMAARRTEALVIPTGDGVAPVISQVSREVANATRGEEMRAGQWQALEYASASELWFDLVLLALRASEGHGERAIEFLMTQTAFGTGRIDSKDPGRYARQEWVTRDVARISAKIPTVTGADLFEESTPEELAHAKALAAVDRAAATLQPETTASAKGFGVLEDLGVLRDGLGDFKYLVYSVIPKQGVGQIYGAPGSGKTPYAIDLALAIARGRESWFGHEIDEHGEVVYMAGEDLPGIVARFEAQLKAEDPTADIANQGIRATTIPAQFCEPGNAQKWIDTIKEKGGNTALVILDTQITNFGPGNENSTEDMAKFMTAAHLVARELECCVVMVHHSGLVETGRARGSSVALGGFDFQLFVKKKPDTLDVAAYSKKSKNWAEHKPLLGVLVPVELRLDQKGRMQTAITLQERDEDEAPTPEVFEEIETPKKPMKEEKKRRNFLAFTAVKETEGRPVALSVLVKSSGLKRSDMQRRLADLAEAGLVKARKLTKGEVEYTPTEDVKKVSEFFNGLELAEIFK